MAFVYWIHLPEHTDMFTEGYIGFTSLTVEHRFKIHKSAANNKKLKPTRIINCFKKYGDRLCVSTLVEGSNEYCLDVEFRLRPEEYIGWNISPGGTATRAGMKNLPEHTQKVAEANRGQKRGPEIVEANRQRGLKQFENTVDWNHPYSNKDVWANADIIYSWFQANPGDGRRTIGRALDMPSDSVQKPLIKIKEGWIPCEDLEWIRFSQEYKNKEPYGT